VIKNTPVGPPPSFNNFRGPLGILYPGVTSKGSVLMKKWRPPTEPASQEWNVIYQIVVSHSTVLNLAHDTPMAGHLGVTLTGS